jgi:hypothetical protein
MEGSWTQWETIWSRDRFASPLRSLSLKSWTAGISAGSEMNDEENKTI